MKIEFGDDFRYQFKDAVMVEFLKDDLENVKQNLAEDYHPDDVKYNKKLIKAYKRILDYYGVKDGQE
jgi:hypothetical protein